MYESLSELLLACGLQRITMEDLLALPSVEDQAVRYYLDDMLRIAEDTDDDIVLNRVYIELERLWDEGIDLLTDDESTIIDVPGFWRMLKFMPTFFMKSYETAVTDGDIYDEYRVHKNSLIAVLMHGFAYGQDAPLDNSDFESVLGSMPDEIIYDFLSSLADEPKLRCLMRLALADEGWLFTTSELHLRTLLLDGGSMVCNAMIQLFDGLGVKFNIDIDAPEDPEWARNSWNHKDYGRFSDCSDCFNPPCPDYPYCAEEIHLVVDDDSHTV